MCLDYLQAGEHEKNGLKDLASTGYYSSDTNYMLTLQSFCKGKYRCDSLDFQTLSIKAN